ncbi:MAG TPA: hypothetical protein VJH68_03365 [Candidatus Nanoarchaeia archaeon]|nr:hypothetical protein [Candidatus Nanoarchaeia archaeon]
MIDHGHEQAAVIRYVQQSMEGLIRAAGEPLPRFDHTYEIRAARGELSGMLPTARTLRDLELGKDLSDLLGKSNAAYSATSPVNQRTAYSGWLSKSSAASYSGTGDNVSTTTLSYSQASSQSYRQASSFGHLVSSNKSVYQ